MPRAFRRVIVTVRVLLFHSDVTVRLLDMLLLRPHKQEYTCLLNHMLRLSQLIVVVICLVGPSYGVA